MPAEDAWTQAIAEQQALLARLRALVEAGVRVIDPGRTWIAERVIVEPGATLWPNITLLGACRIAAGAEIRSGCWLADTIVGKDAVIEPNSVCEGAEIGPGCRVGPMAHLRAGARLERGVKVGNFVEVKNTLLHAGAKAGHLAYLGDAEIGEEANIGAGTITCNYDGYGKHRTAIGARAFIGSNTSLVAPVSVGDGAITGAGSVISEDVPADALAVERAPQRTLTGKAPSIRARNARRAGKPHG
jgi:bifunctional UDP-N-acetylglucosamine pyrophosphorylase/glucosamine-1-phosphate N-acetyltransferase